jgi:Domain of unknown function (DUF4864)
VLSFQEYFMRSITYSLARAAGVLILAGGALSALAAPDVADVAPPGSAAVPVPTPGPAAPGLPSVPKSKADKLTATDREKIQRVITLQIRAFERNDEAIAFSYSSPESRRHFGTPRAFMDAVRIGYSALYRNTSRQFLEAATIDGITIQPMRVITANGETIVAFYTMEQQADQEWRVGGCELSPATNTSV